MKSKTLRWLVFVCLFFIVPGKVAFAASDMGIATTKQPGNKVKVAWDMVEGAVKYNVQVSVGSKNNYKTKASIIVETADVDPLATGSEATNTEVSAATADAERMETVIEKISKKKTYYFKVVALDANGAVIGQDTTNLYNGNIVS